MNFWEDILAHSWEPTEVGRGPHSPEPLVQAENTLGAAFSPPPPTPDPSPGQEAQSQAATGSSLQPASQLCDPLNFRIHSCKQPAFSALQILELRQRVCAVRVPIGSKCFPQGEFNKGLLTKARDGCCEAPGSMQHPVILTLGNQEPLLPPV